ncbi:MAG TPA: hypothetical protein VK497_02960 [Candidatus Saccharimonadales bacterium]|jgi:mannitol-specific phosphotransferase system IIBC component|nr:hypothetical protein [Candidatus Saccharimonadales bacterium]
MKKSDIAMIILIASISVLIAYFVAKAVLGDVQNESVKVKTTEPITSEVTEPDKTVFNTNAINPTVEVIIGGDGQSAGSQP